MRQRWLLNLVLFAVIIGLGILVFYTLEQEKGQELPPLTPLKPDQVQTIRIERQEEGLIEFTKNDHGFWQMVAPFQLPANPFRINRLLEILSITDYQLLDRTSLNLAEIQLESPKIQIAINGQHQIALGNNPPIGYGKRYVQVDQAVYLLEDTLFYNLSGKPFNFINLSPLGESPKITALKMPDYHFVLQEGEWTLLASRLSVEDLDSSPSAIKTLIDNWETVQASNVQAYVETETKEPIEITLENQPQPLHFVLTSKHPDLILGLPEKGVQYHLPLSQSNRLFHLPTQTQKTDFDKKESHSEEEL